MSNRLRMTRAEKDALAEAIRRMFCYRESEESEEQTVDAVPVVRCKDCKYSKPIPRKHSFLCDHDKPYASYLREPYWFCADGERKEV